MQITIANKTFKTKKEMTAYTQTMLKTGMIDRTFLTSLLKRHPWAEQKIGCGIDYFFTDYTEYGTKCFHIKRIDGSVTDFSYRECINPSISYRKDFTKACREAIKQQIESWLEINDTNKCVKCGSIEKCEVDHYPVMFKNILSDFIRDNNIKDFKKLTDCDDWDNVEGVKITDDNILYSWQQYHAKYARYRSLCKKCNSGWNIS